MERAELAGGLGGPNSTQWNHQISAVRVTALGEVLDSPPIAVHNTVYRSNWVLSTNGAEWVVALQSTGAGEADVRAVRIDATGEVLNPGGTQLLPTSTSLFSINIASALNSAQREVLLLWGNSATGPLGQRYDADLNPIGSPFPVNSTRVASNGTGYFLVWSINDTYWDDFVFGQRLSVDGVPGPVLTIAGAAGGLPIWNPPEVGVGWDGFNWWVSWLELTGSVVFSRVTPGDQVLDFGGIAVDPNAPDRAALQHAIAGGLAGGLGVVWADERAGGASLRDIHAASVTSDATPGPAAPISTSARAQLRVDFAVGKDSGNNEQLLAVYLSEHAGVRQILGQRLSATGDPLDIEPFEIASGLGIGTPHAGFDGTRYLVVWSEAGQTYGRRVGSDGSLIDAAPLSIMDSASPDVAGLNGIFLVVGTRPTIGAHFVHPFSMRINGVTGVTLDSAPVILGQYFARFPRVIAFGGRWLATWQRNISHDNPNSSAWAAFVKQDGTTTGEFIYGSGGATPDVASAGDQALLVWRLRAPGSSHNDIYGRLLLPDGTLTTGAFPISAAPNLVREFDPAVTWNGTEFVVAWTDTRSAIIYFDKRSEVFAARVAADGTVIDPAGFAVGDVTDQEILPSVTSIGGKTILATSSFRDDPALQAYRIAYQVFGDDPVGNRWPVAIASGTPGSGDVPLTIAFSAAGSFDPDDPDGSIASYAWDFGDGDTGSGVSPTHTYNVAGEYLAELTVTDTPGASTSNTVRINVTPVNQPPVAVAATSLTSGRAPMSVVYQAAGSYDPDDGIAQILWDFDDGWTYSGGTAYHTYSVPGIWTTTLTITDHRGASAVDRVTIVVGEPNQPPTAIASADPSTGVSPLSVNFYSSGSSDPDGSISGYRWNFGDGDVSYEASPTHVYQVGGVYRATLTVTDNEGGSDWHSVFIDVTQGDLTSLAIADFDTSSGTVTGSFLDTDGADRFYEALTEEQTNGKPAKRISRLEHTWVFDAVAGPNNVFYFDGYHTSNNENDNFLLEYSQDGITYAPMLEVTATDPDVPLLSYHFSQGVSGRLYVRVVDTDRTAGNSAVDTLYVDEMFIVTSWVGGGDTTPPAAPAGLYATPGDGGVSLDWSDNGESDLDGYHVYRATSSGGPYKPLTGTAIFGSAYADTGLTNGTTYHYMVTAVDTSDNESGYSIQVAATPQVAGVYPAMHVDAILLSTVKMGRGVKRGRAEVTVLDDQGNPVAGATVAASFGGYFSEAHSGTTNGSGVVVFTTDGDKKGGVTFSFCVDSVTGGLSYDPDANAETCDTF